MDYTNALQIKQSRQKKKKKKPQRQHLHPTVFLSTAGDHSFLMSKSVFIEWMQC